MECIVVCCLPSVLCWFRLMVHVWPSMCVVSVLCLAAIMRCVSSVLVMASLLWLMPRCWFLLFDLNCGVLLL